MKPLPKKDKLILIITSIFALLLIVLAIYLIYYIEINKELNKAQAEVFVSEVIDGDTFKMSEGTIIRLLCVDTPEQEDPQDYERATKFLESLILYQEVRLEQAQTMNKTDKYNRELRFVYIQTPTGEVLINKEIVRLGFGVVYEWGDVSGECAEKINFIDNS